MPATDVRIAGVSCVLAPGGYARSSDGVPEGRARRVTMRDFFGGQRRAFQLERDRGWDGLAVHGAFGGQGVEPWPATATFADSGFAPEAGNAPGQRAPHVTLGGPGSTRAYVAIGGTVYRCPIATATTWSGLTAVAAPGGDARQLAAWVGAGGRGADRRRARPGRRAEADRPGPDHRVRVQER